MKKFLFLIIIGLFVVGYAVSSDAGVSSAGWKALAQNIAIDYQGKIISIEQLNGTTCWVVLSSRVSESEALKISERIGDYIRNNTKETPSVHVFVSGKHIAIARPHGKTYKAKYEIRNWSPDVFNGEYRP